MSFIFLNNKYYDKNFDVQTLNRYLKFEGIKKSF